MPKITIDGREIEVDAGTSIIQAADYAGIEIPRFCYHERLAVAGNCRMCLVEVEKVPKPVASCAQPVADGMVVKTDSPMVKNARNGVMEFLLINHPLDCPICDQGGECDLQDETMAYGADRGRYLENKRAVKDKDLGPLVKTVMTRCIHCTRCIRFISDVAGVPELGATGRGEHMEVGTYVERALTSELSGNIVDLCPVGALTSKPYAFTARSWELRHTDSVDVLDAMGSAIRVDTRGNQVMRVLPRLNEDVNEEWLGDKSRYACDGLIRQRLDRPYVRKNGRLQPVDWSEAFAAIAARVKGVPGSRMAAIAGDLADAESMFLLKGLMGKLGSPHIDCRQDGAKLAGPRASWLFNSTIAGIEQAGALLLIGTNPRREAPVLNARIRKRYLAGKFPVALVGEAVDLTYRHQYLGDDAALLAAIASGEHPFAKVLKESLRPMLILGAGALARPDGTVILALARQIAESCGLVVEGWNGFNVLQHAASRVGGLEMGFLPGQGKEGQGGRDVAGMIDGVEKGEIEIVYLLGADEIDIPWQSKSFVIYQGHHGDRGAQRADVVLPGAAYTEKSATYVNMEGRAQHARRAAFPPGEAREDWRILRALSELLGQKLPYDSIEDVRAALAGANPVFGAIDHVVPAEWVAFGADGQPSAGPLRQPIDNYYMTDVISRSSPTMADCTRIILADPAERTGTHG